ncbi:hypothetical protein FQB35_00505 [Crassaminicella thermophila]|uniref:SH3b domain-containing protein n=1 Tax=Crassaminicella thermophila TaxID=2599308 RepID=A0A5C0SA23_CRATE|nr:SH3 domain-containing protein [Crassaminicella thermophila]QEK10971.1 hypothetical protein FQB35_00505 [Crassaminicella thermophila]
MKKVFKYFLLTIVILFCFSMFSVNYAQEVVKGIVIDKNAVLCEEPKNSAKVLAQLQLGEAVFIEENHGSWYKVWTNDAMFGWVHSESVLIRDNENALIEKGIVDGEYVNIYKNPDQESDILGKLGFLTEVTVVKKDSDWYQLAMGNEIIGWTPSKSIITTPFSPKAKVIVENGKIYEKAFAKGKFLKNLGKNNIVTIDDFKNGWFHVSWSESEEGWIAAKEVKVTHKDFIMTERKENPSNDYENKAKVFEDIIETATYLGEGYSATAYDLSIASCGKPVGAKYRGYTRTGLNLNGKSWEEAMVVAVDPRVIPLGSKILVLFNESDWRSKYNGVYLAADTGGGVKGKTIDLYLGDIGNAEMPEVRRFGRTYNVKVYLLN